ncbi:MAG: hypothetical protein LBJ67_07655 [Planctomycetaceae bacterium]|jgi:serpin B|nr:hypothetical protein [Planctomycetaceae bacterium]
MTYRIIFRFALLISLCGVAVPSFLNAQETPPASVPATPSAEPPKSTETQETTEQPKPVETPKLPLSKEGFNSALAVQFLAYNTYSQLAASQKDKNFCFSPLLLAKQLTVLRNGASNGKTAEELFNIFPVDMTNLKTADLAENFNQMSTAVFRQGIKAPPNLPATFAHVNAVWIPANYPIVEQYINGIKTFFHTDLYAVDFIGNRDDAINTLNAWSRDSTNGKIPSVIDEPIKTSLPGDVSIIAAGIAASTPRLLTPFHQQYTSEQEFTTITGEKKKTPIMRQITPQLLYFETPELTQIVSLPCVEENLYVVVFLPATGKLDALERQMTPAFLSQAFARLQTQTVDLTLPKTTLTSCLDLTPTLQQLGLQTALSADADFSFVSQSKENPLKLTSLLHETQVAILETAAQPQQIPKPTALFYANRPFVFLVWNVKTATPLIVGRIVHL